MSAARRMIVATVGVSIVAVLLALVVVRVVSRSVAADRLSVVLADSIAEPALTACRAGAAKSYESRSGVRFLFFDVAGAGLDGGEMDALLRQRLAASNTPAVGRFVVRTLESRALIRMQDAGPCAFAEARWRPNESAYRPAAIAIAAVVAFTALLLALCVNRWIVVPLVTRVEERGAQLASLLAELTHDVRTPLASLQFALDDIAESAPEDALPALRRALSDVVYLRSLTSNLRLARRLEGDERMPRDQLDLIGIVQRVVERARPFAMRRAMELRAELAATGELFGDATAVEQAVTNIIENAIAYCPPGSTVIVKLTPTALTVEDNGTGELPPEDARQRGGLGLTITRAVCERCGWRLTLTKAVPTGMRVTIAFA